MTSVNKIIQQRHRSILKADFLQALFQQHISLVLTGDKKVCLFGAGSAGKELAECLMLHGIVPALFCETGRHEKCKEILNIPVVAYKDIKAEAQNYLFLVATNNFKEELKSILIKDNIPFWVSLDNREQFFYYLQIYKWHFDFDLLDKKRVQEAYELLEDEISKDIYLSRLSLLTSYADYEGFCDFLDKHALAEHYPITDDFSVSEYTPNYESYLYFNNGIFHLEENEILLDCGAFDGDTAIEFVNACRRQHVDYEEIISFEADADNYLMLLENTKNLKKLKALNTGVWSHKTRLSFLNSGQAFITEARVLEDAVMDSNDGISYINTSTIDEIASEKKVTLIKMDIEGAEIQALIGAEQTIKRHQPKLAISVYHKKEDLFEIPLLIKRYCPEYKIYIRHLSSNLCETVMFAHV